MYFSPEQMEKFREQTKTMQGYAPTFLCKICKNSCGILGRRLINKKWHCATCATCAKGEMK